MKLIWLSILLFGAVLAEKTSYENYKLVDVFPETKEQFDLIAQFEENTDFDLWGLKREGGKVALSPVAFLKYSVIFRLFNIRYNVVNDNLQRTFDEEARAMEERRLRDPRVVGRFARHSEVLNWLESTAAASVPGLIKSTYTPGKSHEGRDLRVIRIGTATSSRKIWIDCGIHAREWISPATCIYIIDALIDGYSKNDATARSLLAYYEIHVMPVQNPDGYEHTHTTTRLWRKNRKAGSCVGVDLNRNYGYQWMTGGSSNNPCSDTYAGPSANSEPETQAVQAAINAYRGQWDAFLTLHTYGKWIFTVWGYTTVLPSDFTEQNAKAKITRDAIQDTYNEGGWTHGNSANMLYIASGGSEDWAKGVAGINYAYCWELRPGQTGVDSQYGFTLPEDRAPKAGLETYNGLKAFLLSIKP